MKNLKDGQIVIIGILIGILIQFTLFIIFRDNLIELLLFLIIVLLPIENYPAIGYVPFDSHLILFLLPMIPALILTLYRPQKMLKWLFASIVSLLLAEIIINVTEYGILCITQYRRFGYIVAGYRRISDVLEIYTAVIIAGFILSLVGVLIGCGIRKGIQIYKLHNKTLPR